MKHKDKLRQNIQSVTQKNKLVFFLVLRFSVQILQNLPLNCFQHYFIQSEIIWTYVANTSGGL